uniref:Uncharacterized protein n=1 Tax=Rhizophora mucronata TaxID=61149 RepID=A0A2P2MVK7_RHIMU
MIFVLKNYNVFYASQVQIYIIYCRNFSNISFFYLMMHKHSQLNTCLMITILLHSPQPVDDE